jgi:rod shape-determining protein MreD
MKRSYVRDIFIIGVTFFLALCLSVLPLTEILQAARPDWVIVVLIYWVVAMPHRVGIICAWCIGLLVDVLHGQLMGQSALIFVIVAFFSQHLYQRLRMYLIWQQAGVIFLLVGMGQFIKYLIQAMLIGQTPQSMMYLLSAFTSALLWPCVYLILRSLRRHYDIW